MPRRDPRLIGYLLLSPDGAYHWTSPGYRPLRALTLQRGRTLWDEHAQASAAARAALKRYSLVALPTPTRCFLSL